MHYFSSQKKTHVPVVKQDLGQKQEVKNMNCPECNHKKDSCLCCCSISQIGCILPVLKYIQIKKIGVKKDREKFKNKDHYTVIKIIHIQVRVRKKMLKSLLFILVGVSMISTLAFAEQTLLVQTSSEQIKALDSIWITGKITDASQFKPVKLKIIGPDGALIFAPQVSIKDNGEFQKLLNPPIPSFKEGVYLVTASHEDLEIIASTEFIVTYQTIPRNPDARIIEDEPSKGGIPITKGISMSADAINGSDVITITGNTNVGGTDITLIVRSPVGNLVAIGQVTPSIHGDFEVEMKIGGSMWKEDGIYTITANQGTTSAHKESIQVEIKDGIVVPEFGVIASLILAIAIISVIIISTKSKLTMSPKY